MQEAGVDEPDVAKTDGEVVASVRGPALVVTDVSGEPRELSRVPLPRGLVAAELLLVRDTVVVLGETGYFGQVPPNVRIAPPLPTGEGSTTVITIDISDPAAPRVEDRERYGGSLVSAREYDGTVRLVISTATPTLDFVEPNRDLSPAEAEQKNRQVVAGSDIEDWLPSVGSGEDSSPLLSCTEVRHPDHRSGLGTLSVVTFDAASPANRSATAVTTAGELVYSSTERLYLATSTGGWWGDPVPIADVPSEPRPQRTQVHAFALEGAQTTYVGSGDVPGRVRDRWSFSEHDGHLRVATALGEDFWSPRENAVVVLQEQGERLVEIGRVAGMGPREQIQSVRWFGDLAVLVTFRQVDPLYTVDLSDPTDPEVTGELKIPGFSGYLHPLGEQRLLGLGQDATLRGITTGAQAAVFDIGDLRAPARLDTVGFGSDTDLVATADPRAFTYLADHRTVLTPVQDYRTGRTRLAVLTIATDGSLTRTTTEPVGGFDAWSIRTLPLGEGRVALVSGGKVTTLSL